MPAKKIGRPCYSRWQRERPRSGDQDSKTRSIVTHAPRTVYGSRFLTLSGVALAGLDDTCTTVVLLVAHLVSLAFWRSDRLITRLAKEAEDVCAAFHAMYSDLATDCEALG